MNADDTDSLMADASPARSQPSLDAHVGQLDEAQTIQDRLDMLFELLSSGLKPFIVSSLQSALGDDAYQHFLPPPTAGCEALLRFVRSKWLGVFADTALEPRKEVIQRVEDGARDFTRARSSAELDEVSKRIGPQMFQDVELLLTSMRKHALAARVAQLSKTPSAPPVTRPLSNPTSAGLDGGASEPNAKVRHDETHVPVANTKAMPVAIDGSNVAWRHGGSRRFSIRGVAEALAFFGQRGHPSVVFLPEGRMRTPPNDTDANQYEGEREAFAALKALEGGPQLVLTPDGDYDDSYIVHFARTHGALVVSNDNFADQIYQAEAEGEDVANDWKKWLAACRVPFTFHGHAFVPNPTFSVQRAQKVSADLGWSP